MKTSKLYNSLSAFALFFIVASVAVGQTSVKPATEDDLKAEIAAVPCKNEDRLDGAKKLFVAMGATDADISVQEFKKINNLVVTKKGKTDDIVIISAHYDKVKPGCGAIDNWTGIVIIANLYRAFRDVPTDKTLLFIAFDQEEPGLYGSEAMAKSIPKAKRETYCSDLNLDSFGFSYPQVMDNTTTSKMSEMVKTVALEAKIPFTHASIPGAGADSASFRSRGIPSITLHGLNADWQKFLHSDNDIVKNINPTAVFVAYEFTRRLLTKIDASPCSVFRN